MRNLWKSVMTLVVVAFVAGCVGTPQPIHQSGSDGNGAAGNGSHASASLQESRERSGELADGETNSGPEVVDDVGNSLGFSAASG
jgi:hypothetical protein